MPLVSYATSTNLGDWIDTVPDNADLLLKFAAVAVARACARDPYTDTPTTAEIEPLRDATCITAASWSTLGISPQDLGLATAPVKRSTLLDATVETDTTGLAAMREKAASALPQSALDLLLQAGLLWLPVPIGADPSDRLPDWGQGRQWCGPFTDSLSGELTYPGDGWPW